jgi:phosphate transport system protein
MERIIDSKLKDLETTINKMCILANRVISIAIYESLNYGDSYNEIKEISDLLMILADQVEDNAVEIILKFQPVASDLRTVKTFMRISYDLARLGRYALDIAYVNKHFDGIRNCKEWIRNYIENMSTKVLKMIELTINSIKNKTLKDIKEISELEKNIDKLYLEFLEKITENNDNKTIVSSVLIVRYLERIADHMVYAFEALIYMITGRRELIE